MVLLFHFIYLYIYSIYKQYLLSIKKFTAKARPLLGSRGVPVRAASKKVEQELSASSHSSGTQDQSTFLFCVFCLLSATKFPAEKAADA